LGGNRKKLATGSGKTEKKRGLWRAESWRGPRFERGKKVMSREKKGRAADHKRQVKSYQIGKRSR